LFKNHISELGDSKFKPKNPDFYGVADKVDKSIDSCKADMHLYNQAFLIPIFRTDLGLAIFLYLVGKLLLYWDYFQIYGTTQVSPL